MTAPDPPHEPDDRAPTAQGPTDPPRAAGSGARGGAAPVPLTQQLGRVTLVVLVLLFAMFAAANSQRVDFSWVFGDTQVAPAAGGGTTGGVPLILLLVAALVLGIAIGALVEWQILRGRRAKRHASEDGSHGQR